MKYYFAPLDGITNLYYRKIYDKYYGHIDKYYIPFLAIKDKSLSSKCLKEIDPNNNKIKAQVVPQIISKNIDDTILLIKHLVSLGYTEVNLNFGCPSPTVTTKGKGAGILKDLNLMDSYLKGVFKEPLGADISIKLRLGFDNIDSFDSILNILNKYNIKELIIHPRCAKEQYSSFLHLNILDNLDKKTKIDIIYNGEINSKEDALYIINRYKFIKGIMIGRGLIKYPDMLDNETSEDKKLLKLKAFYNELSNENIMVFGWNNSKYYHKEIWAHLIDYFECDSKLKKQLFKTNDENEFIAIANEIFKTGKINKNRKSIKNYINE